MSDKGASFVQSRKPRQTELLFNISQEMKNIHSLNDTLAALLEITTEEIDAERGTIFLLDEEKGELFSRVAMGNLTKEIRIKSNSGIAGHVFTSGEGVIIDDAYNDERFNRDVDSNTGYVTKNILCAPIRTPDGKIIGVAQFLNKKQGCFTKDDMAHLGMMTMKTATILKNAYYKEKTEPAFLRKLKGLWHAAFGG